MRESVFEARSWRRMVTTQTMEQTRNRRAQQTREDLTAQADAVAEASEVDAIVGAGKPVGETAQRLGDPLASLVLNATGFMMTWPRENVNLWFDVTEHTLAMSRRLANIICSPTYGVVEPSRR
jgi:hypothetical protein